MSDSPFVRAPLDPKEKPILESLLEIRTTLELLKSDRSTYVKSSDVIEQYHKIIEQVHKLNDIRIDKRDEQNRVDTVLDNCFQLISLSFMTIGKNQEAPAVYSFVSTVKRLLDHLREAAFFSAKDLESIDARLHTCHDYIGRGKEAYDAELLTLLKARLEICEHVLAECKSMLSHLTPEKAPMYEKLVSILRSLSAANTKTKFPAAEVKDYQNQLRQIAAELGENGEIDREMMYTYAAQYQERSKHMSEAGLDQPEEHDLLVELLRRNILWAEMITVKQGKFDERFRDTYDRLLSIKTQLDKLQLTHTWSMRETDLYNFQRQLDRIDEMRVGGNWVEPKGEAADLHTQRTMLYLLRKSYAMIYMLLVSSEPVSEALQPIYNQLSTLKKCLIEVRKAGGVSSPRELYPYSMKLNSIDNMRVDGKFMVGDDIPDGQGAVNLLLHECFELAYELRNEAESEKEGQNGDEAVDMKA